MRDEYDISELKRAEPKYLKRIKKPVTVRLDPQVIAYFKRLSRAMGFPYQSLINYVLRDYANLNLAPTANWKS
jgi:uncharacterized protein (DUF4415 family)